MYSDLSWTERLQFRVMESAQMQIVTIWSEELSIMLLSTRNRFKRKISLNISYLVNVLSLKMFFLVNVEKQNWKIRFVFSVFSSNLSRSKHFHSEAIRLESFEREGNVSCYSALARPEENSDSLRCGVKMRREEIAIIGQTLMWFLSLVESFTRDSLCLILFSLSCE